MVSMKSDSPMARLAAQSPAPVTPKPVLKPRPTLPKQAQFNFLHWEEYRIGYSGLV